MGTTQREIDSSSRSNAAAIGRQPDESAGNQPLGGRGFATRPANAVSEPLGRRWRNTPHAFVAAPGESVFFAYSLCELCHLPSIHRIHSAESRVQTSEAGRKLTRSSLAIEDPLLACPACNQLVKSDDDGTLAYHEVGLLCPLPKEIDRPCARCLNGYAGGIHLEPCQGSYTKGHRARHSFSFLKLEDGLPPPSSGTRALQPVESRLFTSRLSELAGWHAVSELLCDVAHWLKNNNIEDADFQTLHLSLKFCEPHDASYYEAIVYYQRT